MISNRFQISETNSKNVLFYFFEQNQYCTLRMFKILSVTV